MLNRKYAMVTIPGDVKISDYSETVQANTVNWAQEFNLSPFFKPLKWYDRALFGVQAAREYPFASLEHITLAGELLTWLFTVDDSCDRGSEDKIRAVQMTAQLDVFISILQGRIYQGNGQLELALGNIVGKLRTICSDRPFLYQQFSIHMTDYLTECKLEIKMQLHRHRMTIEDYYRERPFTGFCIMYPLVAMFAGLRIPEEVYTHPVVRKIELEISLLGCLSNDLHSIRREAELEEGGFNLILIAKRELDLTMDDAIEFVAEEHSRHLREFETARTLLPDFGDRINTQLAKYIAGVYQIVRGYDDWAVLDTERYR
ncbi:hypothetical protein HGH92_30695 [Chitinophaga varians]|uniref:Terpene synthase n=1 Tax=Chitinophaga varians TaxID=2202339 RepID=A0A847SAH9_9BACT|nr:hypothetical protein [Chitinophaga varians]NLR68711.1 hypothetical protein [Chitinophaga varians]